MARTLLEKELKRFQSNPCEGICATPQDNNIMFWNAVISGPDNTPWSGGRFQLTLRFLQRYPFQPPTVRFVSQMFHPNIYADGNICLDMLQDQWSSSFSIMAVLLSIQSLLFDPNPDSPANSEASRMFIENKREYNRRVREMVELSRAADSLSSAQIVGNQ